MDQEPQQEFQHAEAFCLMKYKCRNDHLEVVWNSRDGVTPMFIDCASCPEETSHFHWSEDVRTPEHIPHIGQRYFRDGTYEEALHIARQRYSDNPEVTEETIKSLAESINQPGWPNTSIA